MYAQIEKNKLHISVAEFYSMDWYGKDWLSRKDTFDFKHGSLEIDIHKNGKKYLTGFVIDPGAFIVDYLKTRYKKTFDLPRQVISVSVDTSERFKMFSVDFLKAHGFVVDGMEKDLIFPQFIRHKRQIKLQGFDVLDVVSVLKYLVDRFKYSDTSLIRMGNEVYHFKSKRRWSLERRKTTGTIQKNKKTGGQAVRQKGKC